METSAGEMLLPLEKGGSPLKSTMRSCRRTESCLRAAQNQRARPRASGLTFSLETSGSHFLQSLAPYALCAEIDRQNGETPQ